MVTLLVPYSILFRALPWFRVAGFAGFRGLELRSCRALGPKPKCLVFSEASKGGMEVGRIKDPLEKDSYLGVSQSHLPSSRLLRPPLFRVTGF